MLDCISKAFSKKNEILFSDKYYKRDDQIIKTDKSVKFTSFENSLKFII